MTYTDEEVERAIDAHMEVFARQDYKRTGHYVHRNISQVTPESRIELLEAMRAAIASLPRQALQDGWRWIAEAPPNERGLVWVADQLMDRNPIFFGGVRECRVDINFETHRYPWAEGLNGDWNITHWRPLPAPPQQDKP